ncbi:MAG: gamma-glutamyl-gamma-aminobutyrate hydrolase family protein [Gemmatimonadetes bacterium]|nr:gamma-glutamyl-gamma-aminobutyrate hydrolase family protein [Gemmatimonadota bacterium]
MSVHLRRPTVGITTQTLHSIDHIPAGLPQSWVMNQRYLMAVSVVGAVPIMIPLYDDDLDTLREIYDRLDAVLIPGGVDMNPTSYGEQKSELCGALDPSRDRVELQLVRWAIADKKPVLGLCRGLQVINVAMGGTLYQDLEAQYDGAIKHDYFPTMGFERDHLAHAVEISAGSHMHDLLEEPVAQVNSMHHQGIKLLAPALVASAIAPDGLIEGVESADDHFLIGVQWHPEMLEMQDPHERHMFGGFVQAAREWHGQHG